MVGLYVTPIGSLRIVGDHFDCAVKHHDLRPVPVQACGPPHLLHSTKAAQHTAIRQVREVAPHPVWAAHPSHVLRSNRARYAIAGTMGYGVHAQRSASPTLTAVV